MRNYAMIFLKNKKTHGIYQKRRVLLIQLFICAVAALFRAGALIRTAYTFFAFFLLLYYVKHCSAECQCDQCYDGYINRSHMLPFP